MSKCYPVQSISHVQPGFTAPTLLAVLLGINGPREVVIRNGVRASERQVVASLYIADASEPLGVELSVWGENARRLANLSPMSVLHIPAVTKRTPNTLVCDRPHHITTLKRSDCNCKSSPTAIALKQWHRRFHGPLANTSMRCDSKSIPSIVPTDASTGDRSTATAGDRAQLPNDNLHWMRGRVTSVRIRTSDPNQAEDIPSALQHAVIRRCAACGGTTNDVCACPPCESEYQLDERRIAVRVELDKSIVAYCTGADLARLILYEPRELLDIHAATRAAAVLHALAADKSLLHIALRREPSESLPRLHELRF